MTQLLVVDVGVEVHGLGAKDEVYLCGSDAALGAWNVEQALRLTPASKRFAGGCTSWRSKVPSSASCARPLFHAHARRSRAMIACEL